MDEVLSKSPALWNRDVLDLRSDEILAQILDRGEIADWRALYRLSEESPELRKRILSLIERVPLPMPYFWMAAMAGLGETINWDLPIPAYADAGI